MIKLEKILIDENLSNVMTKCDLGCLRAVPTEDTQEFAERENLCFMETSALEATNIESAFLTVLTEIYRIMSKKSLIAEGPDYGKSTSLKGTKIIVPGQDSYPGGSKGGYCIFATLLPLHLHQQPLCLELKVTGSHQGKKSSYQDAAIELGKE
ncbi:hypothetical protein RJ640_014211 [Escallonia rubra]|uniref:Uncharacterized protein n=1 Tax=Escallonia rubra TaxID=112253 RepID=A0AA88RZG8_9ASTE|nr:hypothetical protein RJ640_014211 [Escallonia rubra]